MRFILTLCAALLFGMLIYASDAFAAAPTDGYTLCAAENAVCKISAPSTVIYGAGDHWTAPKPFATDTPCTNAVFTDPIYKTVKSCWVKADAPPAPVNPCGQYMPDKPAYWYDDLANAPHGYQCAPAPVGLGTSLTVRVNAAGATAWWYCPSTGNEWRPNWAAATTARLTGTTLIADAYSVLMASDPLATLNAVARRNVTTPLDSPELAPVWCPWVAEMVRNTPGGWAATSTPPPAPAASAASAAQ